MRNSKRAQAHVEIILATTLFIGFLLFLFVFLNSSLKTAKEIPTDKIQMEILEQTQEEVGKLSVVLGSSVVDPCFNLDDVNTLYGTDHRIVQDPSNPKRYTIYYGNFLTITPIPTCPPPKQDFTLGNYLEEEIIVEANIVDLKSRYESDYSGLKQDLGLDSFAFEFRDIDNNPIDGLSVQGKIPDSSDIISKDFPVRVINQDAEMSELILNIKAWN